MSDQQKLNFEDLPEIKKIPKKDWRNLQNLASILGVKYPKFIDKLKHLGIIINSNGRNIPRDKYIKDGWFKVENKILHTNHLSKTVQKVTVTELGYSNIVKIFI